MTMHKLTWTPYVRLAEGWPLSDGTPEVLATGTLEECKAAWTAKATELRLSVESRDPDRYGAIGLLAKKGTIAALSVIGRGSLDLSLAPELTEDAVFEVRPAAERDAWVPAGSTQVEAEVTMRRMGDGPGRLLILRNNGIGELTVWQANSLGYLDFKGTHEQFYGV